MKPLILYFSLAYLISWLIWLPLYGPTFGLRSLPVLPYHHAFGGLGPLLSTFITTRLYFGKLGMYQLTRKCFQIQPVFYLLIAFVSPFLLAVLIAVIIYYFDHTPISQIVDFKRNREFPEFNLFALFLYNLIFFGFGEEVGWRGFALPQLQSKYNAIVATFLLTIFWVLWHLPLFLYRPGYVSMESSGIIGWVMSLLTGSILLTWLFNYSNGSILICAVFHATIDIVFTANWKDENILNYIGVAIIIWGVIALFILNKKKAVTTQEYLLK